MNTSKVQKLIKSFCESPLNTLHLSNEPAWGHPLIGFASGSDSLFQDIKNHIGDFYWTPEDAFQIRYPDAAADELTVVCWVLPQTDTTKKKHARETSFPSENWARSRKYGEEFNNMLHNHMLKSFTDAGIQSVSPTHLPEWNVRVAESVGRTSTWSHRHAAYVAGLGTFGLSDGLITKAGIAMRCGSVIIRAQLPPTPRRYYNKNAYCLYYANGTCGACIRCCPAGAICESGHDKEKCMKYVETTTAYIAQNFGMEKTYGCGLCQAAVPCESAIPAALRKKYE